MSRLSRYSFTFSSFYESSKLKKYVFRKTKSGRLRRKNFNKKEQLEIVDLFFVIYFNELLYSQNKSSIFFPLLGRLKKAKNMVKKWREVKGGGKEPVISDMSIIYDWYDIPFESWKKYFRLYKINNGNFKKSKMNEIEKNITEIDLEKIPLTKQY